MQINHAGRQAMNNAKDSAPIAPSAIKNKMTSILPKEMTEQDIERVIDDFVNAALRVKKAGFDAVQIQAAHGMLINQFLSPFANRRKDKWGGALDNRMRFLKEINTGCRKILGENYPLLIKLNAYDNMKHGLNLDEGTKIAQIASEMGFDGIEISCGIFEDGYSTLRGKFPMEILIEDLKLFEKKPVIRFIMRHFGQKLIKIPSFSYGFNLDAVNSIKRKINIPIFALGGMHSPDLMIDAIKNNKTDYISLCRPLIIDPAFPQKIKEGDLNPSKCLQCNHCFFYLFQAPLKCYYGQRIGKKL
jgi:2,4-dienoyl-CoA reductase-like NADH-dependent reductase (Old Yellow Enzyme family)